MVTTAWTCRFAEENWGASLASQLGCALGGPPGGARAGGSDCAGRGPGAWSVRASWALPRELGRRGPGGERGAARSGHGGGASGGGEPVRPMRGRGREAGSRLRAAPPRRLILRFGFQVLLLRIDGLPYAVPRQPNIHLPLWNPHDRLFWVSIRGGAWPPTGTQSLGACCACARDSPGAGSARRCVSVLMRWRLKTGRPGTVSSAVREAGVAASRRQGVWGHGDRPGTSLVYASGCGTTTWRSSAVNHVTPKPKTVTLLLRKPAGSFLSPLTWRWFLSLTS